MTDGRKECTIQWVIENFSHVCHKNGEPLVSPEFMVDGFEGTIWNIVLYPRGERLEDEGYISLYLCRYKVDDGPVDFFVKFKMSILAANGLCFSDNYEGSFKNGDGYGSPKFLHRDEALQYRKADYLTQDILSLSFKIWKGTGNAQKIIEIAARTRIRTEKISFIHFIESFKTLEANEKKGIEIKYPSRNHWNLKSSLYFIEDPSEGKIMMEFTPSDRNRILVKCKISLLDISGKKILCGEFDNRFDAAGKDIQNLPLSITRKVILEKSSYLLGDNLSLSCECFFSSGVEYSEIERTSYEKPSNFYYQISNELQPERIYTAAKKCSVYPTVIDDLKAMFKNQLLTDVEVKTKTKSFHAHKVCLCVRSPVFQNILTSGMKEKSSIVILIDDLEDDILQQFLLYLYSDELEKLCYESAFKLYQAADKYQVENLKVICSTFLMDNVNPTSVSELLILSETNSDSGLKKYVQDFIFEHEDEVFGSEEWKKFTEINPQLALKTMLLKYNRKMEPYAPVNRQHQESSGEKLRKIISFESSLNQNIKLHKSKNAWKPLRKCKILLDEKDKLKRSVQGVLNKLTPQKFETLLSQLKGLNMDTEEKLALVADLIFEKAIDEPKFSVPYANLCKHLTLIKVPKSGTSGTQVNFRKLLLTKCQKEFEQDRSDKLKNEEKMKTLEAANPDKRKEIQLEYEEEEKRIRYRQLGNIRFIGELFKLGMLIEPIMHEIVELLSQGDEESLECVCLLLKTIGKELDDTKMDMYFAHMKMNVDKRLTSSRVRFMLQDVIDLKKNNWIPRRDENNPETIDQIHKEAEREAREQQQVYQNMKSYLERISDDRDRRKNTGRMGPSEDGWTSSSKSSKGSYSVVDPSKLKLRKPDEVESIRLGPGGRGLQSLGRGSSGGTKTTADSDKTALTNRTSSSFFG